MTVLVKKEWLKSYGQAERLGRMHSAVHWPAVYRWGWLLAITFLTVLFFIWQNVRIVQDGYEIEKLKQRLDGLQGQNSLLTVEAASLEDLLLMEQRAIQELGMHKPAPGQVINPRYTPTEGQRGQQEDPSATRGN